MQIMRNRKPWILLPDDPLKKIREKHSDNSEIFMKWVAYEHYYFCLKIIASRLNKDHLHNDRRLARMSAAFKQPKGPKRDSDMVKIATKTFKLDRAIKLDNESFVLFGRIMLNKLGALIEVLIGHSSTPLGKYEFNIHKEFFTGKKNRHHNPAYSKLLEKSYWYDQYFSIIRNEIVQHGKQQYIQLIRSDGGYVPISIATNYGILSAEAIERLKKIVKKYAPDYYDEIKNLEELPLNRIPVLAEKIMKSSAKIAKNEDIAILKGLVIEMGAVIDARTLASYLVKFLKEIALFLVNSSCTFYMQVLERLSNHYKNFLLYPMSTRLRMRYVVLIIIVVLILIVVILIRILSYILSTH